MKEKREEIKEKIARNKRMLKHYNDKEKMLMREEKQLERKERTRRLIERGAMRVTGQIQG